MERIRLEVRSGDLVGYATILPMTPPPEIVIFGERAFVRVESDGIAKNIACRADRNASDRKMLVFREGLAVPVTEFGGDPLPESEGVQS
jgi:hypothetical protein